MQLISKRIHKGSSFIPYLWLVIGTILLLFSNIRWTIPAAIWFSSIFFIRFIRNRKYLEGLLVSLVMYMVGFAVIYKEAFPLTGVTYYAVACGYGLIFWIPFIADKLLASKLKGFLSTLVFPVAYTSWEYIFSLLNPYLTTGSMAYTQYGNLPLVQSASVVGMWGIVFLITWFASVVNWAWENEFNPVKIRKGAILYAGIWAMVILLGGARLALFAPDSKTVRVSSLVATPEIEQLLEKTNWDDKWNDLETKKADTPVDQSRLIFNDVLDKYLNLSSQQARSGSKIVFWQEAAVCTFEDDEKSYIEKGKKLAAEENIYLFMSMLVMTKDFSDVPAKNKVVAISPEGKVVSDYIKSYPVPVEPVVPGNGKIPVISTPYGKIAIAICFDYDNPSFIKQAGNIGADIMINPSYDFKGITPFHTYNIAFRAIENGVSIIRCTGHGFSAAYDYQGRVLSARNYFENNDGAMVSYIPSKGTRTIYPFIGYLFPWACIATLILILGIWIFKPKRFTKKFDDNDIKMGN